MLKIITIVEICISILDYLWLWILLLFKFTIIIILNTILIFRFFIKKFRNNFYNYIISGRLVSTMLKYDMIYLKMNKLFL